MSNCSYLLNDGSLILLNDGTSNLLLNDNSCGGGGGVTDGRITATGIGTAAFIGNSLASNAAFSIGGTASALFIAGTDSVFRVVGTGTALFRSPIAPAPDPNLPANTGAGGYGKAWDDHWRAKEKRNQRKRQLLALIRTSDDYKRLKRKLDMLNEHLLDAKGSRIQTIKVKEKIAEIEAQIEMMEWLE